ncbi:NAD(P)H-quinone oxidoreductase [Demequina lutea]|uniref:Putative PIG3 family NAD(P)H quinone oxidoreductase n=1 Tax=Demequina lutea TaxID=431489 RepID=A0A7Z0CIT5_9MICO|nr:NAD(P)H-quinone oxidoreductase [Demequina lutea]NYI40082.1 putative PIG3 family NAD(P)H quinone oxidoreductase [Demequina lutea]
MRIISVTRHISDNPLRVSQIESPVARPGEVLIDILGAGVNRADLLQRRGSYPSPSGWPEWPGLECAGTISAVGDDVQGFQVGDHVCALVGGGAYAEQIAAPADLVLPAPSALTLVESAALMEAACTVWSNFQAARLMPGETLVIHGGSGGIGTFAIQVAKALGVHVIVTARGAERTRRCLELGADVAVDYTSEDFVEAAQAIGGADVILDVVGAAYLERNLAALATGGRLVVIGLQRGAKAEVDLGTLMTKRAHIIGTTLRARPHAERAAIVAGVGREVWPLIPDKVRPVIHGTVPFDDAQAAHDLMESGEVFGKVVLVP